MVETINETIYYVLYAYVQNTTQPNKNLKKTAM